MSDDTAGGHIGEHGFAVGQLVAVRADRSRTGPVIAVLPYEGGTTRYRVFHSSEVTRDYAEDQLVAVETPLKDEWAAAMAAGEWCDPATFRSRLTSTRLANPQIDHIYALRSARIQFIPFQFKPLLRLLRADRPRLLIADDVGVGKTIEAGLIMKELSTRQPLDRVLVVCPKALTVKWRAEMRRFDEEFRTLDARSLRYCLDEASLEGAWPAEYSRSIVHYELLRMEQYLNGVDGRMRRHPGLLELDPSPRFDLVIADEAHHLRTPGTGSHQMMEHLCDVAEAVLMLSATPVQVSADNLFVLLSLLRPDLFPDITAFREITEPNKHLTAAVRGLRAGSAAGSDWLAEIGEALDTALDTAWGRSALRSDPTFGRVVALVASGDLSDEQRVRCIRDLEEVHPLAHVMNRTRRRDIGRFTIREPRTVSVPFTQHQRALYDKVVDFRRQVLLEDYPPIVVNLILNTLERQAASSINALAQDIDRMLGANGFDVAELTDDPEVDNITDGPAVDLRPGAAELLAMARSLPADDPKADRLVSLVHETLGHSDSPGKVLVFSFFLHTLEYLRRRLDASAVRVAVITGQTPDDEREALRDRFRLDRDDAQALDVLLSSEVGCEGLDYEFCDRLVNYDIPWNPMRLEQRIGRIDRFGQTSDKVFIFNFVTPGTVEERVFVRCYERLGVFRDTVGDLEEVLGPMVQELTQIALDRSLTGEQAEERARQVADNALRRAEEQRRLDDETAGLLGLDDAFTDDVDAVVDHGRSVSPADIEAMVTAFLAQPAIGGTVALREGEVRELRLGEPGRSRLAAMCRSLPNDRAKVAIGRNLESGEPLTVTFDQETALAQRAIDFVTPVHPLARLATGYWLEADRPLLGGLVLSSASVTPGRYLFTCERWETISARPDLRLECLAVAIDNGTIADDVARDLLPLLGMARIVSGDSLVESAELISERLQQLTHASESRRRAAVADLVHANDALIDRRLASLRSFYSNRIQRVRAEHETATEARILRMKAAELSRIESEYAERSLALEGARTVEILSERVAAGYIEVVERAG